MKRFSALLFLLLILSTTIAMLFYPQAAYQGACQGLETWIVHLVPSLLPFFIVADLLLSLGFVRFLGVLLEPVMRPLFRLPGEAGFAVALGFTSGFPMGAILTASLKEQKLCTPQEAARLAAFTNNSSPLFLLIAVPVSMLHQPQLGVLLLSAHYLANLTIGILLRFTTSSTSHNTPQAHLLRTAIQQMQQYQTQHILPLGALFGQAIQKGIRSIVNIGGFVMLFSVLLALLQATDLLALLQKGFTLILTALQFNPQFATALSAGLFEMTLGAQTAAQCPVNLLQQLMVISFILGWSGLSIQAQVSSILSGQQISARLYCLCRPLQGLLASLYNPLLTVFFPQILSITTLQQLSPTLTTAACLPLLLFPAAATGCLLLLSGICHVCSQWQNRG